MNILNNNLRLTGVVNKVSVANPSVNYNSILKILEKAPPSDITLLPSFSLVSPSSGSLLEGSLLIDQSKEMLDYLRKWSHKKSGYYFIGLVSQYKGHPVSSMGVLYQGNLVAQVPLQDHRLPFLFKAEEYPLFQVGDLRVTLLTKPLSQLVKEAAKAAEKGCDLLLVPLYEPLVAGEMQRISSLARELSTSLGLGIGLVNGGVGDSSSPYLYDGFCGLYEGGKELALKRAQGDSFFITADFDPNILKANRPKLAFDWPEPLHKITPMRKEKAIRTLDRNPFLPLKAAEKAVYLEELFAYQVSSLATRLHNTGLKSLVLGVSGGLDSTAALLVSVEALSSLELPLTNLYGLTMPGLGTSDHTYYNALALLENLGVSRQDISIRPAVLQHFEDIGHRGQGDTTYENAQARERTQILLDVSNIVGGLVVGTGDLSEEALGFSTFGGDHFAGYNVNACMTKTMLRELLQHFILTGRFASIAPLLQDVLDTPISPELLPPNSDGSIKQLTEDILGPYELHEFFLYYFVGYRMAPSKIYLYASEVFSDTISKSFIKEKLKVFLERFCKNQFKRSFAPDAASITPVNLLSVNFTLPSDLSATELLLDLDSVD